MVFFKEKIENIVDRVKSNDFFDKRFLGLVMLAVLGLSVVWNGAKVVQQNYGLLQKIAVIEEENRVLELENKNKEIKNEYYKTDEFAELKARKVNGKAAPGESVYIVTNDVALSSLKTPDNKAEQTETAKEKPKYQKNFEAWMNFFFGDKKRD